MKFINGFVTKIVRFFTIESPKRRSARSYNLTAADSPEIKSPVNKKKIVYRVNKKRTAAITAAILAAVMLPMAISTAAYGNEMFLPKEKPAIKASEVLAQEKQTNDVANAQNETPVLDESTTVTEQNTTAEAAGVQLTEVTGEQVGETPLASPAPSPSPAPSVAPVLSEKDQLIADMTAASLKSGVSSPSVVKLQQRLMDLDYLQIDEPTELYGDFTTDAVKNFQKKHELDVDGIASQKTLTALFSDDAKKYTVSIGADGVDVEHLQTRLKELGYSIEATGYFGADTESVVKYFQRMNGLTDDGNIGSVTREALYSNEAVKAEVAPTPEPSKAPAASKAPEAPAPEAPAPEGDAEAPAPEAPAPEAPAPEAPAPEAPAPEAPAPEAPVGGGGASALLDAAQQHLGKPYVLGAKGPNSFDCSGFVYYVLNQSGTSIGYMTSSGWAKSSYTSIGSMAEMQPGDIISFKGHVGIYMGNDQMIDCGNGGVRICDNISSSKYWTKNFLSAKRLF